jgi:hypothetical protein
MENPAVMKMVRESSIGGFTRVLPPVVVQDRHLTSVAEVNKYSIN